MYINTIPILSEKNGLPKTFTWILKNLLSSKFNFPKEGMDQNFWKINYGPFQITITLISLSGVKKRLIKILKST